MPSLYADEDGVVRALVDRLAQRPVDRAAVDEHKRRMLDEVRAYQLRELREALGLTQVELADALDVSQNRISRLEHGTSNAHRSTLFVAMSRPSAVSCTSKSRSVIDASRSLSRAEKR